MQTQRISLLYLRISVDMLCITISFFLANTFDFDNHLTFTNSYILLLFILLITWSIYSKSVGLYDEFRSRDFSFELISLIKSIFIQILVAIICLFFIKDIKLSRSFVFFYTLLLIPLLGFQKYILRYILNYLRKKGRNLRNVLIVGAGSVGKNFHDAILDNPHFGYRVIGFLDDENKTFLNGKYLGTISALKTVLDDHQIDNVLIALPNYAHEKIEEVVRISEQYTTRVKIIPDYFRVVSQKYSVSMFGPFPVISVREDRINALHWRILKRAFDISFSGLLFLILFWWLFPIIALIIRIDSKGPVIYKQERLGRNNKRFCACKFRSMVVDSKDLDSKGKFNQAKKNDPRITKVGKFIRKTNIDELPQFWNVLKGDMSVVGPRPHPLALNLESKDNIKHYMIRHLVKPGITGWAQINGFRGETSQKWQMQKRIDHDIWYLENWSFLLDIQIIILTVWRMLKGDPQAY